MKTILIAILAACSVHAQVGPSITILRTNVETRPIHLTVTTTTVKQLSVTPVTINGKQSWVTNVLSIVSETSVTNAQVFGSRALKGTNAPPVNLLPNRPPVRPRPR